MFIVVDYKHISFEYFERRLGTRIFYYFVYSYMQVRRIYEVKTILEFFRVGSLYICIVYIKKWGLSEPLLGRLMFFGYAVDVRCVYCIYVHKLLSILTVPTRRPKDYNNNKCVYRL